jgi:hypothetical protein
MRLGNFYTSEYANANGADFMFRHIFLPGGGGTGMSMISRWNHDG